MFEDYFPRSNEFISFVEGGMGSNKTINTKHKFIADIDCKIMTFKLSELCDYSVKLIRKCFKLFYDIRVWKSDIVVLDGNNNEKHSLHIIINNQPEFNIEQYEDALYLFELYHKDHYKELSNTHFTLFDDKLKDPFRTLRMLGSRKIGGNKLKIYKHFHGDKHVSFEDALVRIYNSNDKCHKKLKLTKIAREYLKLRDKFKIKNNYKDFKLPEQVIEEVSQFGYKFRTHSEEQKSYYVDNCDGSVCPCHGYKHKSENAIVYKQMFKNYNYYVFKCLVNKEDFSKNWKFLKYKEPCNEDESDDEGVYSEEYVLDFIKIIGSGYKDKNIISGKSSIMVMKERYLVNLGVKSGKELEKLKLLFDKKDAICIVSQFGTGKTEYCRKLLEIMYSGKRILSLSAYILTAIDICRKLKLHNYRDLTDLEFNIADRICVTLESLSKLVEAEVFDIIILDESVSLLQVISRGTIKERLSIMILLKKIIKKCVKNGGKLILMDGRMNKQCIRFLQDLDVSYKIIVNNFKLNLGDGIEYGGLFTMYGDFIKNCNKGLKCNFISSTKGILDREVIPLMKKNNIDLKKVLIITNDMKDEVFNSFSKDPDKYLKDNNINIVLATSKLGPGISILTPFDKSYIYFNCLGCDPASLINTQRRFRNYTNKKPLLFYINENIAHWIQRIYNKKYFNEKLEEKIRIFKAFCDWKEKLQLPEEFLMNQIYYNKKYKDIYNNNLRVCVLYFLKQAGYNVIEGNNDNKSDNVLLEFEEYIEEEKPSFEDVKLVDENKYNELVNSSVKNGEDKYKILKFAFMRNIKINGYRSSHNKSKLWDRYIGRNLFKKNGREIKKNYMKQIKTFYQVERILRKEENLDVDLKRSIKGFNRMKKIKGDVEVWKQDIQDIKEEYDKYVKDNVIDGIVDLDSEKVLHNFKKKIFIEILDMLGFNSINRVNYITDDWINKHIEEYCFVKLDVLHNGEMMKKDYTMIELMIKYFFRIESWDSKSHINRVRNSAKSLFSNFV